MTEPTMTSICDVLRRGPRVRATACHRASARSRTSAESTSRGRALAGGWFSGAPEPARRRLRAPPEGADGTWNPVLACSRRSSRPPCVFAMSRQTLRPSPRPCRALVEKNGSKARARTSSVIPSPSSMTAIDDRPAGLCRFDDHPPARRHRVDGVQQQVEQDLPDLHGADQHQGAGGVPELDVDADVSALEQLGQARPNHLDALGRQLVHRHRLAFVDRGAPANHAQSLDRDSGVGGSRTVPSPGRHARHRRTCGSAATTPSRPARS